MTDKIYRKALFEEDADITTDAPETGTDEEQTLYTEEQLQEAINRAVKQRLARERKAHKTEAERLEDMSQADQIAKLNQRIRELETQTTHASMVKTARGIMSDEQVSLPDTIIEALIRDTAEETKDTITDFAKVYKAAVAAGVKQALAGKTPKAETVHKGITKDDIMKEKDSYKRIKLIQENLDLFD